MSRSTARGPKTVHGFNPPSSSPFTSQPISIPNPATSANNNAANLANGTGGVKAVKLDLHRSNHAAPMPSPIGYFSSHSPNSHSPAAPPSVPAPSSFRGNNVTLSVYDSQQSSAASSTGTTAPNSSNSSSQQISPSHAMLISPSHAQPVNHPFHPSSSSNLQSSSNAASTSSSSSPQRSLSHSMPVSIPAFRRAASFVGMDTGFDLFASEIDNSFDGPASSAANSNNGNKPKQQAPRIQNVSQLGQQLRQHLSQNTNTGLPPTQPPAAAPTMQKTPSYLNMSDADALPDISSPPPTAAHLQFAFDSPDSNPSTVQISITNNDSSQPPKQLLDFDAVGVNSKQQVLGAIPHVHTPPQPSPFLSQMNAAANQQQQQNPNHLFAPSASSRWTPLSSSAPSNLPSFNQMRRNSAGSVASSTISSQHTSKKPSSFSTSVQRRNDAHTPTTIASEDLMSAANANNQTVDSSMQQDDNTNDLDDDISDREVEALLSHEIHNDGSSCSLSSCSSCSGEDSDLSVNLEDDFDVKVTFNSDPVHGNNGSHRVRDVFDYEEEDEVGNRLQARLNRDKKAHHAKRHLHHRRRRIRLMLKHQREEQRLADASLHGEGDEIQEAPSTNPDDVVSVGSYTHGERAGKIQRYMEKRARRVWSKKILYPSRKNFADNRVRVGGRFVKLKGNPAAAAGSGGAAGDESGSGSELAEANSAGPFSLSTSPWATASAAHSPGLPLQQMMLNPHASGAFSLPSFSNYLGTSASASPATTASERGSFSKPGMAGGSTLSFIPEPLVSSAASSSGAGPSALSANLHKSGLARQLNANAAAAAHPPAHSAPPASSNGTH